MKHVMKLEDWNALRVLTGDGHNWGNPKLLDRRVVLTLDAALFNTGLFHAVITSGTGGKHSPTSFHYPLKERGGLGMALDFMLPTVPRKNLPAIYKMLMGAGFGAVGIYADWKLSRTEPPIGGFHVDVRENKDGRVATWMQCRAIGPGFLPVTAENMARAFR
ncbi:MAG: hypothetical protein HC841_00085 [Verrucomicrobiae bacterium]|nr:hypothetical protein [Verrucomicrobiae bacterium]